MPARRAVSDRTQSKSVPPKQCVFCEAQGVAHWIGSQRRAEKPCPRGGLGMVHADVRCLSKPRLEFRVAAAADRHL